MAADLYEVHIIHRPTAEQREQGKLDELFLAPTQVLADSNGVAIAIAVQQAVFEKKITDPIQPTASIVVMKRT